MKIPRKSHVTCLIAASLLVTACSSESTGSEDGSSNETVTIDHALDDGTEVPASPDTVVALDPYVSLPTALATDVEVLGASHLEFGDPFPAFIDPAAAEGVEDVGWFTDLDLEKIASLEPDVVIGSSSFVEPYYDQLSNFAPTVALELGPSDWKDNVELVGTALGRSDQVTQLLDSYSEKAGQLAEELAGQGVTDNAASILNIRALDDLRVYTKNCSAQILGELGFPVHLKDQTEDDAESVNMGIERLPDADAHYVLYFVGSAGTNPEDAQAAYDQISTHPLWDQLSAVQEERIYDVDPNWWFDCGSVQAAERVLDDVSEYLATG